MTKNELVIYNWIAEGLNKKNLAHLPEFFAQDYRCYGSAGERLEGLDEVRNCVLQYFEAFPDLECSVGEMISAGDRVVLRWTFEGTHRGEFMGLKPTLKRTRIEGISILRMADHKIAEEWEVMDLYGAFKLMGAFPQVSETVTV